jgi:hypothetical protein
MAINITPLGILLYPITLRRKLTRVKVQFFLHYHPSNVEEAQVLNPL